MSFFSRYSFCSISLAKKKYISLMQSCFSLDRMLMNRKRLPEMLVVFSMYKSESHKWDRFFFPEKDNFTSHSENHFSNLELNFENV